MSRRSDELYLDDIAEAAAHIAEFLRGVDEPAFRDSELIRSAVLQKLSVIGEAAARMSETGRQARPNVPWRDVVAFRNIAVHAYFAVDWGIVWYTATVDVVALRAAIGAR